VTSLSPSCLDTGPNAKVVAKETQDMGREIQEEGGKEIRREKRKK
jgi:hypothetical protein